MSMGSYSFCADDECVEPLDKHLREVAWLTRCFIEVNNTGIPAGVAVFAGLMHDLGKILSIFQADPSKMFVGHELVSALIAYNIVEVLVERGDSRAHGLVKTYIGSYYLVPVVYAILVHHQAQSPLPHRVKRLVGRIKRECRGRLSRDELFPNSAAEFIVGILNDAGIPMEHHVVDEVLEKTVEQIRVIVARHKVTNDMYPELFMNFPSVHNKLSQLSGSSKEDYLRIIHLSRVLAGYLMASDKLVSVKNREFENDERGRSRSQYYVSVRSMADHFCRSTYYNWFSRQEAG